MSNVIFSSAASSPVGGKSIDRFSSAEAVKQEQPTAEDKFMEFAKQTPAERMRSSILSSMGLTEEKLAAMPEDQRKAIEQKIEDLLKQAAKKELEKHEAKGGFFADFKV